MEKGHSQMGTGTHNWAHHERSIIHTHPNFILLLSQFKILHTSEINFYGRYTLEISLYFIFCCKRLASCPQILIEKVNLCQKHYWYEPDVLYLELLKVIWLLLFEYYLSNCLKFLLVYQCQLCLRESLGLQGDPTSPFWRRSALGFLWKEWC